MLRSVLVLVLAFGSFGQGIITTVAGTNFVFPSQPLPALSAPIAQPAGIAFDTSGNFYVADSTNSIVMKVNRQGTLSVFAGNGSAGFSGDGGSATSASLNAPEGIAVDAAGNLFIADSGNNRIRKVTPTGIITTISLTPGDQLPNTAVLSQPGGVAVDSFGNLFIEDGYAIRKVTAGGVATTIAALRVCSSLEPGGPCSEYSPQQMVAGGLAVDATGNVFFVKWTYPQLVNALSTGPPFALVEEITSTGILTIYAGCSSCANNGDGGPATGAALIQPQGLAVDGSGNLYISDTSGNRVRKVMAAGAITTIAGNGSSGFTGDGGSATAASLNGPMSTAVDAAGNVYVGDSGNGRVRRISQGIITTIVGNGGFHYGGDGGPAMSAYLSAPTDVTVDAAGNLLIADTGNNRIRKVTPQGIITTVAGNGIQGFSGDGGFATSAELASPQGIAADAAGNIYVADTANNVVRKIAPTGVITTVAGVARTVTGSAPCAGVGFGDGGPAISAYLTSPTRVAVDAAGDLFIADTYDDRVRKVTNGIITTLVGNGCYNPLNGPTGLAIDHNGNLFVVDAGDGPGLPFAGLTNLLGVLKITPGGGVTPLGVYGIGVSVDAKGDLLVAGGGSNQVQILTAAGNASTTAGQGAAGFSGDGGPPGKATLNNPTSVAVDSAGNIFIADSGNNRIREILAAAPPNTPSVSSITNAAGEGTAIAQNTWIEIKGVNLAGGTRSWQTSDFVNNQLPTQLDGVGVTVNGKPAYVYYISPTQVNVLSPVDSTLGSVQVQVTNHGFTSAPFAVQLQSYALGFFEFNGGPYVAATHLNGSLAGAANLFPGASTPVTPGELVTLYAGGFGQTSPPLTSGSTTQTGTLPALPLIKIGGIAATVQFAGVVSPGLYQLNVYVPASVPTGDNTVTASYNGVNSNTALLSIGAPSSAGTLQIQITGLPVGASGSVSITSTSGFSTLLTANGTIQVPAGAYTITAISIPLGSVSYGAFPAQQTLTVTGGSVNLITISYSIIVPNTTMVLDQQGSQGLSVSSDGTTLTFPISSQTAQNLSPGSILAIGTSPATPNGLLRKIVSVVQNGSQVVAQTTQATLTEAFQQANFTFTTALSPQNTTFAAGSRRPGVSMRWKSKEESALTPHATSPSACSGTSSLLVQMFDAPILSDQNGAITVSGSIEVCPSLTFNPNINAFPPQLNSLIATTTLGEDIHVNVTGNYQGSFSQTTAFADAASDPITIFVGPIPIVLTPSVTFFVGISGSAEAGFSVGVTQSASVTGGLSYANGQLSPVTPNPVATFTTDPLGLDANLSAKAFAGVTIALTVDGILSPSFSPDAYLKMDVNPLNNPWWTLSAGLEGDASVKVGIFGVDLADFDLPNLFDFSKTIAQAGGGFVTSSAAPILNLLTPNSAATGSSGVTLTLSGSNFVPGSIARFNGNALSTTYVSPIQLTATLPANLINTAGTFGVTVTNPDQSGASSQAVNFIVRPSAASLMSLGLSSASTVGGNAVTGTATLSSPAATGGVQLTLSSNNSSVHVPSSIMIAAGTSSATFPITTSTVTSTQMVTITASLGNSTTSAVLTVTPATSTPVTILSVTGNCGSQGNLNYYNSFGVYWTQTSGYYNVNIDIGVVTGFFGVSADGTPVSAFLTNTFGQGTTLSNVLASTTFVIPPSSSANATVSVFSGLALGPGQYFLTLYAPTQASAGGWCTATGQATSVSASGVTEQFTYDLNGYSTLPPAGGFLQNWGNAEFSISGVPGTPPAGTETIQSLTLSSASVTGGGSLTGAVMLSAPAPTSGAQVVLSSSNQSAQVPASVTVAAGQNSASFTITTTSVTSPQTANITATLGASTQAAALTVAASSNGSSLLGHSFTVNGTLNIGGQNIGLEIQALSEGGNVYLVTFEQLSDLYPVSLTLLLDGVTASGLGATTTFSGSATASLYTNGASFVSINSATLVLNANAVANGGYVTGSLSLASSSGPIQGTLTGTLSGIQ